MKKNWPFRRKFFYTGLESKIKNKWGKRERRRTSRNSDWFTPTLDNSSRNTFGRLDFEKQTNFRLVRHDFDFLILQSLNFTFQLENVLKLRKMLLKTTLIFRFNISK